MTEIDFKEIVYDLARRMFDPMIEELEKQPDVILTARQVAEIMREGLEEFHKSYKGIPVHGNWQR